MSATNSVQQQNEDCPICFLPMQKGAAIFTTACGHAFHFDCIKTAIQSNNVVCPICRGGMQQLTNVIAPRSSPAVQPIPTSTLPPARSIATTPSVVSPSRRASPAIYTGLTIPDEDPIDDVKPRAPSTSTAPTEMVLTPGLEYPQVAYNSTQVLYGMLSLKAPSAGSNRQRVPLDLVAVVDRSGSMGGTKIELLRQTLQYMVTQLSDDDRLSIVSFDDRVAVVCGLKRMNDKGKAALDFLIRTSPDLNANGGTDIGKGLQAGLQVLRSRKAANAVTSVLLLTDGQDGSALNNIRNLLPHIPEGSAVHTFGFGSDHDANVLSSAAEMTKGTFTYIENVNTVGDAFATCLGGLLSVVAQTLTVHIEGAPGMDITKIHTQYTSQVKKVGDRTVAEIKLNDLFADEKRDLLFTINITKIDSPFDEQAIATAYVTYKQPTLDALIQTSTITFKLARPSAVDPATNRVNADIDIQKNRILAADALEQAVKEADKGNMQAANALLTNASATIKASPQAAQCANLVTDLMECNSRFSNKAQYQQGGMAYAKSAAMQHHQQRACAQPQASAAPSAYATPMQMMNVANFQSYQQQQPQQVFKSAPPQPYPSHTPQPYNANPYSNVYAPQQQQLPPQLYNPSPAQYQQMPQQYQQMPTTSFPLQQPQQPPQQQRQQQQQKPF